MSFRSTRSTAAYRGTETVVGEKNPGSVKIMVEIIYCSRLVVQIKKSEIHDDIESPEILRKQALVNLHLPVGMGKE